MRFTGSEITPLYVPVTSESKYQAIWTANDPTPSDAPYTRTFLPVPVFHFRNACKAVTEAIGNVAAIRWAGLSFFLSEPFLLPRHKLRSPPYRIRTDPRRFRRQS